MNTDDMTVPETSIATKEDSIIVSKPFEANEANNSEIIATEVTNSQIKASPSESSLSSINSDSSTGKLIKSLSVDKLNNQENEVPKEQTHTLPLPKNSNKKPIKFTVRKVSHEPIKISNKTNERQFSQGKKQVVESHKAYEQIKATQLKYDQYVTRIGKIDKEIDFLVKLLPPYNVEIDYATRTKITKAIEKLKMKQDELDKKKYSLGITISRLWRDNSDSDIWVRSVSNQ
ncbi:unnamed protein product [Debaryomyces tyrocola]|nr:unnamed protein product [Debaryomyces tyrocola]